LDGTRYPTIALIWQHRWDLVTAAFAYPPDGRRDLIWVREISETWFG
jgi:hypothetical protein